MKDYNVVIPMSRLEQLEEIETKFNNGKEKLVEVVTLNNDFTIIAHTKDGEFHSIRPDTETAQLLYSEEISRDSVMMKNLVSNIRYIFNKQTSTLYESLKTENLDRIKKEVEEEYNKLSFSQKFKKLFL